MKTLASGLCMAITALALFACSSSSGEEDIVESNDANEVRAKKIACRSPRLTNEGYRGEGSFVGDDGQVYVTKHVCIQDDDDCGWAQCDAEEGGGDWNGGPKGDWYGFWDTGEPMRGACTVKIARAGCPGGGSANNGGNVNGGGGGFCNSPAHGKVAAYTCVQEADWKWYQCQKDGVFVGAYGPNSGELGPCSEILWYGQ